MLFRSRAPAFESRTQHDIRRYRKELAEERKALLRKFGTRIYRPKRAGEPWVRITALGSYREVGRAMHLVTTNESRVLVQGLTGGQGTFHSKQCMEYGTQIVGGVTPGRGGTEHLGQPVFNTVTEACQRTDANVSITFAPAPFAADSVIEAAEAGIQLIICIAEGIPTLDMARAKAAVRAHGSRLIGPNCPGIITPAVDDGRGCKIGIMPGFKIGRAHV